MKSSRGITWLRIGAESIAIVASILLAFAIDAWWADRQLRLDLQQNLVALSGELESNLRLIDRELSYRQAVISSIETLTQNKPGDGALSPDHVDRLLGDLLWLGRSGFSSGALNSILQTGLLAEIRDGELRRLLAALPASYQFVEQFERNDIESTQGRLYPYINQNGSFTQIANTQRSGRPGTDEFLDYTEYRLVERREHAQLLQSDEFLGLLAQEHWDHYNVAHALRRLRPEIERAITLIDSLMP